MTGIPDAYEAHVRESNLRFLLACIAIERELDEKEQATR